MSDPSQNQPYHYIGAALTIAEPIQQPFTTVSEPQPEPANIVVASEAAPLTGEVLPSETPPTPPQYPIGLIDFNQPIVVVDNDDSDDVFDNPQIIAVLKGSIHPVVISFWKLGEQCVGQFDTDGDSSCGNYKVEQDLIYPTTRFVVIGRKGRTLVIDEELYFNEEAARFETDIEDIAGIFPVVIEAPAPTLADDVAGAGSAHDGINEDAVVDDHHEMEEDEDSAADVTAIAPAVATAPEAPSEMYVAGQMRKVGETVHAYRQGFGTRVCTILKLRRDSRKSLYVDPKDGNGPYWALNKNVRY